VSVRRILFASNTNNQLTVFHFLKADILVNSAIQNLKINTACLKVLKKRGGRAFIEECEQHTDIPQGDIVCTSGGNLACQYVIHAVCKNWNNDEPAKSEDVCIVL
jgi:O-acetyl-ADP-ribose deacetylase (regulator of RNase III)